MNTSMDIKEESLLAMTRKELLIELEKPKELIKSQEEDIDKWTQEKYNVQREILLVNAMNTAYEDEIEQGCEIEKNDEDQKIMQEVQNLRIKIEQMKEQSEEKSLALQQNIKSVNQKISLVEDEVNDQLCRNTEAERISAENIDLKIKIEVLQQEIEHVMEQGSENTARQTAILLQINDINNEIDQVKESIEYSKTEFDKCKESIAEYQAEMGLLRAEIESKKSIPLDAASRGNSMFAELHDHKIKLANKLANMKTQYFELQRECDSLLKQTKVTQNKNNYMTQIWAKELKQMKEGDDHIKYYKELIGKFLGEIEQKRKELKEKFKLAVAADFDLSAEYIKYLNTFFISNERRLIQALENTAKYSKRRIDVAYVLQVKNRDVRNYRLKVIQLESQVSGVKSDLDELCLQHNVTPKLGAKARVSKYNRFLDLPEINVTPINNRAGDFKILLSGGGKNKEQSDDAESPFKIQSQSITLRKKSNVLI